MVEFFYPRWIKLIFLLEWTLFIASQFLQGELDTYPDFLLVGYPLVGFYLVACIFAYLSQRSQILARGWKLLVGITGLFLVDQLAKSLVVAFIPLGTSVPVGMGWLEITHVENYQGSWLISNLNLQDSPKNLLGLGVLAMLVLSIFYHRYYVSRYRQSLWADIAFLGICAGLLSWLWDMIWRGRIIDYIYLPGIVAADFKDILIYIGTAAIFAEVLETSFAKND